MRSRGTPELRTERLVLAPLTRADAPDMVGVLADAELYTFTGGEPPSRDDLERRYRALAAGSPEPGEHWHNWIIRLAGPGTAVGFVQATVTEEGADVAWVVGVAWQRQGIAREAASAMCEWLRGGGVDHLSAHIHPDHVASARVATTLGLAPADEVDDDGERVWRCGSSRSASGRA